VKTSKQTTATYKGPGARRALTRRLQANIKKISFNFCGHPAGVVWLAFSSARVAGKNQHRTASKGVAKMG